MKHLRMIVFALVLITCKKGNDPITHTGPVVSANNSTDDSVVSEPILTEEQKFKNLNDDLLHLLKEKKYADFAQNIHPEKGIRFSMYANLNENRDKHFSKADFLKYLPTNFKFTWGEKDGTGEIAVLTLKSYLQNWVYRNDYSKGEFYLNDFKATGNSLNNLKEIYPNADFTENYIRGTEEYSGMNWTTLRIVFENFHGRNYVVAIVNDQWTI